MTNLVAVKNNQVVVSSKQFAEKFGKEHKNVVVSIRSILVAENSATKFFQEDNYRYRGQSFPIYYMNRDGFALIAMGFTGDKAIKWKVNYINAFNAMEVKLQSQQLLQQSVNNIRLDPHNVEFKNMLKKMQKYLLTLQTLFETWPCSYRTQKEYEGYYDIILEHILDMSREMISFKEIKFKTGTLLEELKFNKKTL